MTTSRPEPDFPVGSYQTLGTYNEETGRFDPSTTWLIIPERLTQTLDEFDPPQTSAPF